MYYAVFLILVGPFRWLRFLISLIGEDWIFFFLLGLLMGLTSWAMELGINMLLKGEGETGLVLFVCKNAASLHTNIITHFGKEGGQ